ncbi:MAG TPA: c-type cytochrome biogenesis protein CcmI [Caulobacteraceae bacterium]|nr:c-type cytochrome biogenesis protein CcmI [Caulobacteraceae bacterium]
MLLFCLAAAVLAAAASSLILARTVRAHGGQFHDPTEAVYRRALEEIDDLAERDLIAESERRDARVEAGRRLLTASALPIPKARAASRATLALAAAVPPILALAVYLTIGSPGYADQPFDKRLAGWRARPEADSGPELAAVLKSVAAERPHDPEPLTQLARVDLSLGDADGAAHALREALAIAPARTDLLAPLGEILTLKSNGEVGPEAAAVFAQALRDDPGSVAARYYLARAQIANGDVAGGLARWRSLLAGLPAGDPRRPMLTSEIQQVASTGALAPSPFEGSGGAPPGAIQAMVDGLAQRLKAHPDDPDGWVRLVRAYAVLGDAKARDAAFDEASRRYASRPDVLARLASAKAPS